MTFTTTKLRLRVALVGALLTGVVGCDSGGGGTIGFGEVWVFTAGKWVFGQWTRANRSSPIELTGPHGRITLTPGRTWVELARSGTFSPLP
ncbi:MAG: DUF3048 C-terminal domain-containing protein [Ilumatobacteraceae bacterium]